MSIFTWSRKVRYSEVSKKGTPSDIAYLPPAQVKNRNRRASQRGKGQSRRSSEAQGSVTPEEIHKGKRRRRTVTVKEVQ